MLLNGYAYSQIPADEKLKLGDVVNDLIFYKSYVDGEYLSFDDLYAELVRFDTVDRSHYHNEYWLDFTKTESGYDDRYLTWRYFSFLTHPVDSNLRIALEHKYNQQGDLSTTDTVFVMNRFYATSMQDSVYTNNLPSEIIGRYKLLRVSDGSGLMDSNYCVQNRYLAILPGGYFTQYFKGFADSCESTIPKKNKGNTHSFRVGNYVTISGKIYVSDKNFMYLFDHEQQFLGRVYISFYEDNLMLTNDQGIKWLFKKTPD